MTASGLFGTVSAVGERIEVEIADGVRVEFLPAAISKVLPVADAADQLDLDDEAPDDLDLSRRARRPVDGDTPPQLTGCGDDVDDQTPSLTRRVRGAPARA